MMVKLLFSFHAVSYLDAESRNLVRCMARRYAIEMDCAKELESIKESVECNVVVDSVNSSGTFDCFVEFSQDECGAGNAETVMQMRGKQP